ncbi:MAG: hypothetical protein HLX51_02670 [Micrococcaceae bacterium]|nr:hypothetical protein [Micrococcaceae bacterium]
MQLEPVDTYCSSFNKSYSRKHRSFPKDYQAATKLLVRHLCGTHPEQPLSEKKLKRIHVANEFEVWKFNVMTQGLRPSQWPRMWLGVAPMLDLIVPLVIDSHTNNYSDNTHEATAISLMQSFCAENLAN